MKYHIEIMDAANRRMARYEETPLLECWLRGPDQQHTVRGLLPEILDGFAPGCAVCVYLHDALVLTATVTTIAPEWSDARKLILDDYINFSEVMAFEAEASSARANPTVSRTYVDTEISAMLRDLINAAPGPLHYKVAHDAYPDGATREHDKFLTRQTPETELESGGIGQGQWVGGERLDTSMAYAKDGDTIAGLVVDGAPWPDLRLMMVDCEETTRNSHAIKRHPEVALWSDTRYAASGYKLRADAAKAALQAWLDDDGIDAIELNPHRNALGEFDDRVDAYGRYIGLVYGGGRCYNAALVELGHADVYLYEDGAYHPPEMALKEYFSYLRPERESVETTDVSLARFDARGGALELIAGLAYAAGGFVFHVDQDVGLTFRKADTPDRVVFFDAQRMGAQVGANADTLANVLVFLGNPQESDVDEVHTRGNSIAAYGVHTRVFAHYGIALSSDADLMAQGLLDDIAYPARQLAVTWFRGDRDAQVGDCIELRGAPLRRIDPRAADEWGNAYAGKVVGRITALRHRFTGRHLETTTFLGSPLRSVEQPLSYILRSQEPADTHFQFRLDDKTIGLDQQFRLD